MIPHIPYLGGIYYGHKSGRNSKLIPLKEGWLYYNRKGGHVHVRKLIKIDGKFIEYETIYQYPNIKHIQKRVRKNKFMPWSCGILPPDFKDFKYLNGKLKGSVIVYTDNGTCLYRIDIKSALDDICRGKGVLTGNKFVLTSKQSQKVVAAMERLGHDLNDPFFLYSKDSCVACGTKNFLSSHHVVPARHLSKVDLIIRKCLSNRLVLCFECHKKYESFAEQEPIEANGDSIEYIKSWEEHFIKIMSPKHLPEGWRLFHSNVYNALQNDIMKTDKE